MERQAKDGTVYKQVGTDEWQPVTRVAKDGTNYLKVGADEWRPLIESKPQVSKIESGVRGVTQGTTLGFSDEIVGGARAIVDDMTNLFSGANNTTGNYEKYRDEERAKNKLAQEANPKTYMGGELAGAVGSAFIPGLGALNAGKGATLATKAGLSAAQGGLYGAGSSEADTAGGVALDAGAGAAIGAAVPVVIDKALSPLVSKVAGKASGYADDVVSKFKGKQFFRSSQKQAGNADAIASAASKAAIEGGDLTVEQGGKLFEYKAPQSLDELKKWKPKPGTGEVLGRSRLQDIVKNVPDLETKPLKYHYDMMENPKAMKELKLKFENLPTEDAKQIATYNQEIVNESSNKIKDTVNSMAGVEPKTLTDAGYDFISTVKDKYKNEKELLGPMFDEIQKRSQNLGQQDSSDLIIALGENTKIGKLLGQSETGRFTLSKNAPRTGLSDSEHGMLARVIDDLNDGMSFQELQKTREFLRKAVDPSNPNATQELNKVRSIMLGQMENMAGKLGGDVQKTFKAYAVNERARESIESIIGGSVDSLDAMFSANPDKVVKKIFSNPNHAKIVENYVGSEKLQELVASYLKTGIDKANDSAKGFSPNVFKNWLKSNKTFLSAYVQPEVAERLSALADYGYYGKRFLDEVNPSGTAASLKEMLEPKNFFQRVKQSGIKGAIESAAIAKADTHISQKSAIKGVNEMLGTVVEKKKKSINMPKVDFEKMKKAGSVSGTTSLTKDFLNSGLLSKGTAKKDEEKKETPKKTMVAEKQLKGRDKWANDGHKKALQNIKDPKLKERVEKLKTSMLTDLKTKKLLVAISSLDSGSPEMKKAIEKLKREVKL